MTSNKLKPRILIVDDDPNSRDLIKILLSKEGYDIDLACDGNEGLDKAVKNPPDLILLDVVMPEMDGFELCKHLRSDSLLTEVPIIMITSLDDRDSRLKGIKAGADDFISKLFDKDELRARVRTIIRLNRYRSLLDERAKFEWIVENSDDAYLIISNSDDVLYANLKARIYFNLPDEQVNEKFLEIAKKQYVFAPMEIWNTWPDKPDEILDAPKSSLYFIRPESLNAEALWLSIDIMEMSSRDERYLIQLRDVSATLTEQRLMWTLHSQISHKLRTPLSWLTGFINILDDNNIEFTKEEVTQFILSVKDGARHLHDGIMEIFHYIDAVNSSKTNRGQCTLPEILKIIKEITSNFDIESINTSCKEIKNFDNICLQISSQAVKLILRELFENAKKFHPEQLPELEIKISSLTDGLKIQIYDNGLTLSPTQLSKMWGPYYQAEKFFTGEVPGMGLGLSMVSSLVWGAGGTCKAYNRGKGQPGIVMELVLPYFKF
ncbi:histidine kinase [Candidatus Magnetomoraceae bacterium gMMP-15]